MRKTNLAQLLRGRPQGIFAAPFEQGEIGPDLFDAACRMGLEGLVSKHRERAYRAGRCDHWIKVKKPRAPGVQARGGPTLSCWPCARELSSPKVQAIDICEPVKWTYWFW